MDTIGKMIESTVIEKGKGGRTFILFEDERVTYEEYYRLSLRYANMFTKLRQPGAGPFHVGVFMENYPEFLYCFGGCAFSGAVLVGINTAQRGAMLARDINHTDCQMLITESKFVPEVMAIADDLKLIGAEQILVNNYRESDKSLPPGIMSLEDKLAELESAMGDVLDVRPDVEVGGTDWMMIIFTSGSTGAPKGILNSHQKMAGFGELVCERLNFTEDDVAYAVMPLFHSNSTFLAVVPALYSGGAVAMRRKFSARGFVHDIKKFGVTTFNYVGKPLAFILSTHPAPDDDQNRLRVAVGNGASAEHQEEFQKRFGLDEVVEAYGATEGGVTTLRSPGDPPGSVGVPPDEVKIMNEYGEECPAAEFDEDGIMLNYGEAVGEIINTGGVGSFEEYYKNPEATARKKEGNMYHTGDLGYIRIFDRDGVPTRFMYFAGRTDDWIRKDGENFLADPIEDIVNKNPAVFLCSAYGVPCHQGDENVMVSLVLKEGCEFDPQEFYRYCTSQKDMSPKWIPDFIRILKEMPQTETAKILRRELKREHFNMEKIKDSVHWRERGETGYKPFALNDYRNLEQKFVESGREVDLQRG